MAHALSRWLRENIDIAFERDPAARTRWEVITTYPGVHAVVVYRLAHRLWHRGWHWAARLLSHLARWVTGVEIHPGAEIGRRFFIDHGMGVVVGETARVGDDVTLYHGVTLGGTTWRRERRHPVLGDGVVVGAGAKLLGPITVGAGSRIGSNAVVIRDVPDNAVVVGIPGRVVAREGERTGDSFDPYGQKDRMPDPVAKAVKCLSEHIHAVERRLEEMEQHQAEAGSGEQPAPSEGWSCGLGDSSAEGAPGASGEEPTGAAQSGDTSKARRKPARSETCD